MEQNFIRSKIVYNKGANPGQIHIGYGIDDNYCRPMAASIASICKYNPQESFHFHVMTAGLTRENISRLEELAEALGTNLTIYTLDVSMLKDLPTQTHLPLPTYFRFLLPLILKGEARLYYVDADIVCLGSLKDLFNMDFQDKIIMAVKDLPAMRNKRSKVLGLPMDSYFNAGMLVIDLPKWQEFNTFAKVLEVIRKDPKKFRYLDQDALNLVLTGHILYLDGRYNCLDITKIPLAEIGLLHFAAHPKPWNLAYGISEVGAKVDQRLYLDWEKFTPWGGKALTEPRNYKEYRMYAKALWHHGDYLSAVVNYLKYLRSK